MNFIHEGGVGAISEHLRQLLAQDVENHLDRKLYEDNLSRSNNSTILKTEFETLLETAGETERQEVQEKAPHSPMNSCSTCLPPMRMKSKRRCKW